MKPYICKKEVRDPGILYELVDVDAINVGEQDLAQSLEEFVQKSEKELDSFDHVCAVTYATDCECRRLANKHKQRPYLGDAERVKTVIDNYKSTGERALELVLGYKKKQMLTVFEVLCDAGEKKMFRRLWKLRCKRLKKSEVCARDREEHEDLKICDLFPTSKEAQNVYEKNQREGARRAARGRLSRLFVTRSTAFYWALAEGAEVFR